MAARRHPAAKDPDTGQFVRPWIVRGRRIYHIDPLTKWSDDRPPGWLAQLRARIQKWLGEGDHYA